MWPDLMMSKLCEIILKYFEMLQSMGAAASAGPMIRPGGRGWVATGWVATWPPLPTTKK